MDFVFLKHKLNPNPNAYIFFKPKLNQKQMALIFDIQNQTKYIIPEHMFENVENIC